MNTPFNPSCCTCNGNCCHTGPCNVCDYHSGRVQINPIINPLAPNPINPFVAQPNPDVTLYAQLLFKVVEGLEKLNKELTSIREDVEAIREGKNGY